jgi:hypothetical protein
LVNNTNQKYILNARVQQSGTASETSILCGSTTFLKNYARDFPQYLMIRRCDDIISVVKTGNDEAYVSIVYFEGILPEETQQPPPQNPYDYFYITNPTNATGNFSLFKNYTYGEVGIMFLLICIFFVLLFNTIKNIVIVRKNKKL